MYVKNLYVGGIPPKRRLNIGSLIPVVAILLVLLLVVSLLGKACSACMGPDGAWLHTVVATGQEKHASIQADFSKLPKKLDKATVKALKAQKDDGRIALIVNNADAYAMDGAAQQGRLLKLAADDPQAIDYVFNLPSRYPEESGQPYMEKVAKGTIPLLMQWDQRWGYVKYCGTTFGTTGCCPTALSMVYMGLTGKTDKTPYDMAVLAEQGGYAYDGEGTVGAFLTDIAPKLGLGCEELYPDASELVFYLQEGYPVIVNVGPGDFTTAGHFLVAVGLDDSGKVIVNDPYSSVRSAKTWSADTLANQAIAMYAFYQA